MLTASLDIGKVILAIAMICGSWWAIAVFNQYFLFVEQSESIAISSMKIAPVLAERRVPFEEEYPFGYEPLPFAKTFYRYLILLSVIAGGFFCSICGLLKSRAILRESTADAERLNELRVLRERLDSFYLSVLGLLLIYVPLLLSAQF